MFIVIIISSSSISSSTTTIISIIMINRIVHTHIYIYIYIYTHYYIGGQDVVFSGAIGETTLKFNFDQDAGMAQRMPGNCLSATAGMVVQGALQYKETQHMAVQSEGGVQYMTNTHFRVSIQHVAVLHLATQLAL